MMDANQSYKFEHFFELSPDLLCIAGFDGYFRRVNPAVSRVLGYSNEELMSRPINDFVFSEDKIITSNSRESVKSSIPLINFENRYQAKDGKVVWLEWTSMPVMEEQLIYAVAKDITSKKALEEDRNTQLARLTKVNDDLTQLGYTTSHDLRTPVNNLITLFSLIDHNKVTDQETRETIQLIEDVTHNLKDVLDRAVDALIMRDKYRIATEPVRIDETLREVMYTISSLISTSGCTVETDFSAFDTISFNKSYLESIFLNLLSNSIKYARTGIAPAIKIRTVVADGKQQLKFRDNGIGFDINKVGSRIFGFNQKFNDHGDSKGIGLYLVYNHVNNLRGTIDLTSEPGQGTEFTITFSV